MFTIFQRICTPPNCPLHSQFLCATVPGILSTPWSSVVMSCRWNCRTCPFKAESHIWVRLLLNSPSSCPCHPSLNTGSSVIGLFHLAQCGSGSPLLQPAWKLPPAGTLALAPTILWCLLSRRHTACAALYVQTAVAVAPVVLGWPPESLGSSHTAPGCM